MANDHRVMADVERRRNRRRDSERKRRRVHRVLEYFESTRCIVTRAYPWSTLSTIRNQPRYTGGGSCTCRANGSLAELRAYTRCRIQIEHIDTTHLPPKKLLILPICLRVWNRRKFLLYEFQTRSTSNRLCCEFRISKMNVLKIVLYTLYID